MKTLPIKLLSLFSLLLVIYSCEKDDSIIEQENFLKTVALEDVQAFLSQSWKKNSSGSGNTFITSISEEINYEDITNTDEELAVIPVTTTYKHLQSRIALLEIDGEVQSVVVSLNLFEDSTSNSFSGEMLITDVGGAFLRAFRIEKNVFVSEYILKNHSKSYDSSQTNFFYSKAGFSKTGCDEDLDPNSTFCNNVIEVFITNDVSNTPPTPYVSISHMYPTGGGDETSTNEWDYGGGSGYLDTTPEPEAEKPCPGDPVKNPEIAPQKGKSGILGAMFGNSTIGGCKRYGSDDCTTPRNKKHDGIDIKNKEGDPIYAMYDGFIYSTKYDENGAGYYTRIQSTVNGQTFIISYFHLQENNRELASNNPLNYVKAGDIIGYQGDSGNLRRAISSGGVESHVHIEVRIHDKSDSWHYDNFNLVNPTDYLSTNIDDNGNSQTNNNCN